MELLFSFGAFAVIALLAAVSPGPDFLVVSKNAVANSRTAGMWTAVGVGSALLIHVTYTLVGIGLIISRSILLFSIIKILGALYLIWLGATILLSKGQGQISAPHGAPTYKSSLTAFKEGFLTNVLNPKATVFFVSIFTQFVSPTLPKIIQVAYGIEVAFIVGTWFVALSILLTVPFVQHNVGAIQAKLMKVMGAALILLGVKVAFSHR